MKTTILIIIGAVLLLWLIYYLMNKGFKSKYGRAASNIAELVKKDIKSIDRRTNKEKRNDYLKSAGYTPKEKKPSIKIKKVILSDFRRAFLSFVDLKYKNEIDIKPYKNKWGIPFYEKKKTLAEQLRTKKIEPIA